MKISLEWLGEFIEFTETDVDTIAEKITAHTAEVDEVEKQGVYMENCCVGQVQNLAKHPDADKLNICTVLTNDGEKKIVCGGTNLRDGMRVAFAHVGASVRAPDGSSFTLSKAKIRGEVSEGMICAASELALEDRFPETPDQGNRPVIDLGDGDEGIGEPLQGYLDLTDTILHIDNHAITHRADLFSHIGFARECVAIGIAKWKNKPEFSSPAFSKDALPFKMHREAEELMPRYLSCLIEIDSLGETPDWMAKRLQAVGWRLLSPAVDITNYVATETGVPLHSFDADDIVGDVHMRKAKKGEKIITLDKQERELPEGALILSDDKGVFDLLGIMGGLRSSTTEKTKRIYLHAASLDPVSIRKAVIGTGLRTDAATVYEKGVPHIVSEMGFNRAAQLMLEILGGARIASELETVGDNGSAESIALSVARTQSLLGADIPAKQMGEILESLEFSVEGNEDELSVTPPLHRLGDIKASHDLVEEVGRVYGFNNIEAVMPVASIAPPERDFRVHTLRDGLVDLDFFELLPLSLVGPDLLGKCKIDPGGCTEIENPIGKETSLLTPSVLPELLAHAERNILQVDTLRTFHISSVFSKSGEETMELGVLVCAKHAKTLKDDSFLHAKQALLEALYDAGYQAELQLAKSDVSFAASGRTADVVIDAQSYGEVCVVDSAVCAAFDLPSSTAFARIDLSALLAVKPATRVAERVPSFPAVSYDTTVDLSKDKTVEELLSAISKSSDLLESVEVVDVYGDEKRSNVTIRCVYRSADKTLTEEEAKKEYAKVEKLIT